MESFDTSKYETLDLSYKDRWGVIMRKDSPLSQYKSLKSEDILGLPLLLSRQVLESKSSDNELLNWFGVDKDELNIIGSFNLMYNASIMVNSNIGYAIGLDKLVNSGELTNLIFRPLNPGIHSGLSIVWQKNQLFSDASRLLLEKLSLKFDNLQV